MRLIGVSLSQVSIEVIPDPDVNYIKIWSLKDSNGRTICYFNASSPLKECSHHPSVSHQTSFLYKFAGEWPNGSSGLFSFTGSNNNRNRKFFVRNCYVEAPCGVCLFDSLTLNLSKFNITSMRYFYLATELLTVVDAGTSRIELSFQPMAGVNSYELWVKSEKAGRYGNLCDTDNRRCIVDNLRPGINYAATLAHCSGSNPILCGVEAKQLAISTKPKCTFLHH